jgi:hypothetical protein
MPPVSRTQHQLITLRMKTNDTRPRGRRHNGGGRRRPQYRDQEHRREPRPEGPKKVSFWHRFLAFFTGGSGKKERTPARAEQTRPQTERRRSGPAERIEVTSPRLYVGNLSYDATESDLFELFKGVGQVQNAEIVTHKDTYRSKGFGFVTMLTVDEAIRAVETLHDKDFMGRRLLVNGSRSEGPREPRV